MEPQSKPLVWLHGEIKTPPFSRKARLESGFLLRRLQQGETLGLPQVRPMPVIAAHCYELRIRDENKNWRVMYHIQDDAILILEVFEKKTRVTPAQVIETCQRRLKEYEKAVK
jgi:phage-related protein